MVATIKIGDFTDVWDEISTIFVGIGLNVVDTASDPGSRLMSLSVDGEDKFVVNKDGIMFCRAIGTADASPAWISLGGIGALAIEGVVSQRAVVDGGGVQMTGFRNADPTSDPDSNAPVELDGSVIILSAGTYFFEVPQIAIVDHYAITKPSTTLPDGRIVVPLVQGPEITYTTEQSATDVRAIQLVATIDSEVIGPGSPSSLVLSTAYSAGDTVSVRIVIEENLGRAAVVTIDVNLDTVNQFTDSFQLSGNRQTYINQFAIPVTWNIGQSIELVVSYIDGAGGGSRDVDVRGDVTASELEIQSASSLSAMFIAAQSELNRFIGDDGEDTRDVTLVETVTSDIIGFTSPSSFVLDKTFLSGSKVVFRIPLEENNMLGASLTIDISLDGALKFTDTFLISGGRNHWVSAFDTTETYNAGQELEMRVTYVDLGQPAGSRDVHVRGDAISAKITIFRLPGA